jgi:Metallo-peptidase family M12/Calx-beta domain/Reprolysin family propeptide/Bacterial pre-peptidase C-terminal domain
VKNNRKLLVCSLIAAVVLSVLPYPSLGVKNTPAPASTQDEPVLTGQLVQGQTKNEQLSKHFRKYDLIRMDPGAVAAQVRSKGRLLLKSSARDFDLHLTPNDLRSPDYIAEVIDAKGVAHPLPKTEVNTYKGDVKGLPGAQVRLSLTEKGIEGAIITKEKRYFLQPAQAISKDARADEFVFYDGADLEKEAGTCAVTLADEIAAQEESTKTAAADVIDSELASGPVSGLPTLKIARIATDADAEYVTAFGGASQANTQIANILNFVDGIYQVEIGVTFQIVQQNAWADQNTDPYTTTAPSALLGEFRNYWNANFQSGGSNAPVRSLAHLFTGKDLDGGVIGIASLGVVCRSPSLAYGLSQRFPITGLSITAQTVVLTAHEIGHNFSAAHTNQVTPDVPADFERTCDETIMEASVGSGSSFCPFSRSQIIGWANAFSSCLTATATPPPASQDCVTTPISPGATVNGNLSSGDCRSPSRGVDYFADRYTFNGAAGQRVFITMSKSSGDLDPFLYLIGPDGYFVALDDDGDGDPNARIPSGFSTVTLPDSGVYIIEATSFGRGQAGSYTLKLNDISCTISASPGSFHFPAGGGSSSVNITLSGCASESTYQFLVSPVSASWVVPEVTFTSGSRTVNFTVQQNSNSAGRRAFLLIGPVTSLVSGGLRIPITQSGTGPDCSVTPIGYGQTLNGTLSSSDCHSPVRGTNFFADRYSFNAGAGQKVTIQATGQSSGNPDTFLTLLGPNGAVIMVDDDSGGQTNSRIPGGTKSLTLGVAGTYTFEVTPFSASGTGNYSVTLTTDSAVDSVQFSQPAFNVGEGQSVLNVPVTRTGNTSQAATVNYATNDNFAVNCNQFNGQASAKCDFNTSGGTLRFAAGETSRNIPLSIVDDGYVEGNETFTLTLSNPTGISLGAPASTTITIVDNDSTASNPFDTNTFFVRQQYLDFLLREPDTGGFNDWLNVLNTCQPTQGGLGSDPGCDRAHVSSGFFRSTEFGERGYWSYRYYHAALGRRPQFAEFLPDMRRLSGFLSPAEEEAARAAFVADFMQRGEFTAIYGGLTSAANAAQFIAKLEEKAGVTLPATVPATLPGQPPQYGRAELIQKMQSGQFTAAQTLRAFIEQKVVFDAFFFRAFVAMQYFGYLLRDPEDAGYNDWVDVLTNGRGPIPPGDFHHLIFGFVWSVEYRQRFGP